MNCEILDTLYVRANGDIPCNDDAGEQTILGRIEPETTSLTAVLTGKKFRHIRRSLSEGVAPWGRTCRKCALFRPNEAPRDDGYSRRHIRKLQIEPCLACKLRCPACSNSRQIHYRPKPWILDLKLVDVLLAGLCNEGWTVDEIEYCGQGEPLLHPQFPEIVRRVRAAMPGTRQRLITSGNADYAKTVGSQALDEIFVSCDGVLQEHYEQYRVRGDVSTVLKFMRDIPPETDGLRQKTVWKYILFEFNDSTEEIEKAQHLAQELSVDELLFVFTHSRFRSQRWTSETVGAFPVLYPNVITTLTAVHDQYRRDATPKAPWSPIVHDGSTVAHAVVDEAYVSRNRLVLRGWAWREAGSTSLDVIVNGNYLGSTKLDMARPDVQSIYPERGMFTGFRFQTMLNESLGREWLVELRLPGREGNPFSVCQQYSASAATATSR